MRGRGGWSLHLICTVCRAEGTFKGVVMSLAADHAEDQGWVLDREALQVGAHDRFTLCPTHAGDA